MVYGMTLAMAIEDGMVELPPRAAVLLTETMPTIPEAAERLGVPLGEFIESCRSELADAIIPDGHISAAEFAERAEVEPQEVLDALDGELAPALLPSGRLDLGHAVSLAFMAARPFARLANGDPDAPNYIGGEPWLSPACMGDDVDVAHPVTRAFFARCHGRVPTDAELGLT
jgi:hypothetical protein